MRRKTRGRGQVPLEFTNGSVAPAREDETAACELRDGVLVQLVIAASGLGLHAEPEGENTSP